MSDALFQPYNQDGVEVRQGDRVRSADGPVRVVTNVFPPEHELSLYYEMDHGCVEIAPATIEELPLNEDIVLIERAASNEGAE